MQLHAICCFAGTRVSRLTKNSIQTRGPCCSHTPDVDVGQFGAARQQRQQGGYGGVRRRAAQLRHRAELHAVVRHDGARHLRAQRKAIVRHRHLCR